jgi:stalled ribosome alternative rescue factor ArfA
MLFIINNLRERASSYYKGKGGFNRRSRGRGNYYNKRGKGVFILISNNYFYPDS